MIKRVGQIQTEETRRCLLIVLNEAGSALRAKRVRSIMNELNAPTTWDDFLRQVEYLTGEDLIRVFPAGENQELSDVQQAKYLALCKRTQFDSFEAEEIMLAIRKRGRHFIEGNDDTVVGVAKC